MLTASCGQPPPSISCTDFLIFALDVDAHAPCWADHHWAANVDVGPVAVTAELLTCKSRVNKAANVRHDSKRNHSREYLTCENEVDFEN